MSHLNAELGPLFCLLRAEYLYDLGEHHGEYVEAYVFGVTSIPSRAVMFHAMTSGGAKVARMPISAFCWKPCPPLPLEILQLWNCFSYDVSTISFEYLRGMRCSARLKDGAWYDGEYVTTLDWCGNEASESPGEGGHKTGEVLRLDNGNFAIQPNNRILWREPSFITKPLDPANLPRYRTNSHVWRVERTAKWTTEDNDAFFYVGGDERRRG